MCLSVRWSVHREHSLKMSLKWQRNTENRHHFLCLSAPWGVTHFLFLFLSTRGLRNKLRINKAPGIALQRTLACIFLRKYPSLQLPKAPLHDYRLCLAFGAGQVSPSGFSEPTTVPCCCCEWIKTVKKQKKMLKLPIASRRFRWQFSVGSLLGVTSFSLHAVIQ